MTEAGPVLAAWAVAGGAALVSLFVVLRGGRRRSAINEAIHELRRPLQAIALANGPGDRLTAARESSVRLASSALERLEREVNGGVGVRAYEAVELGGLARSAVIRWRGKAIEAGGDIELRWLAAGATVAGDRTDLAQALDNLVVNAIEHGGARVVVAGRRVGARLRLEVRDRGGLEARRPTPRSHAAVFTAGRSRGHGLAVVRRVVADHGGRFVLSRAEGGATAVLELPLARDGSDTAA